jgi:hypothetical protein
LVKESFASTCDRAWKKEEEFWFLYLFLCPMKNLNYQIYGRMKKMYDAR